MVLACLGFALGSFWLFLLRVMSMVLACSFMLLSMVLACLFMVLSMVLALSVVSACLFMGLFIGLACVFHCLAWFGMLFHGLGLIVLAFVYGFGLFCLWCWPVSPVVLACSGFAFGSFCLWF